MAAPCFTYAHPRYQPAVRVIASITNSNPALVTTATNHLYLTGMIVRLDIFPGNGMPQANHQTGSITVTGSTTFTITIDTTLYDPFFIPSSPANSAYTCSQVCPVGEVTSTLYAAVQNGPPGSTLPSSYAN